jgi:hypothetical protein
MSGDWLWLAGNRASGIIAIEVWDLAHELALRQDRMARQTGALVQLQFALDFRANLMCLTGDLKAVTYLVEEARDIASATGNPSVGTGALLLEAFRGDETTARDLIGTTIQQATEHSQGRMAAFATYANAVLHNGLGRYEVAREAAMQVFEQDVLGYGVLAVGELAEAASRTATPNSSRPHSPGSPSAPRPHRRTGDAESRHAPGPSSAPTKTPTDSRSTTSARPASASRSPMLTSCTASGCGVRAGASMPATSCARLTSSWTRWVSTPSPSGLAANCLPPVRRSASAGRTR